MSSVAIRSLARTSSFSARSLTLMPSVTVISRVMGSGSPPYLHAAVTWRRHKALHRAFFGLGILRASAASARRSALRARRLAGWRSSACAAGACAEAGTRSGPPNPGRAPKPGRAPGAPGATGYRPWACGWDAWGAVRRGTGREPKGRRECAADSCPEPPAGRRSKMGLAALNSSAGSQVARARFGGRQNGRLVHRPRPGLRHHHAANGRRWRGRSLCAARLHRSCRGLGCNGGNRGIQLARELPERKRELPRRQRQVRLPLEPQ